MIGNVKALAKPHANIVVDTRVNIVADRSCCTTVNFTSLRHDRLRRARELSWAPLQTEVGVRTAALPDLDAEAFYRGHPRVFLVRLKLGAQLRSPGHGVFFSAKVEGDNFRLPKRRPNFGEHVGRKLGCKLGRGKPRQP